MLSQSNGLTVQVSVASKQTSVSFSVISVWGRSKGAAAEKGGGNQNYKKENAVRVIGVMFEVLNKSWRWSVWKGVCFLLGMVLKKLHWSISSGTSSLGYWDSVEIRRKVCIGHLWLLAGQTSFQNFDNEQCLRISHKIVVEILISCSTIWRWLFIDFFKFRFDINSSSLTFF